MHSTNSGTLNLSFGIDEVSPIGLFVCCTQYACVSAPLKFNGIHYAWWQDRHGHEQHFWSGDGALEHTCQCGIDGDCFDASVKCNCDLLEPELLMDTGETTEAKFPIDGTKQKNATTNLCIMMCEQDLSPTNRCCRSRN